MIYLIIKYLVATYYVHAKTKEKDLFVLFLVSLRTSLVAHMVKDQPANRRDLGLIPWSGRSPGEGNGNPLQYSCLENPMDREPGRLQSMGSQGVRNDCAANT